MRTALFNLKKEESRFTNPRKGIYKYIIEEEFEKFDFSDFEHINPSPRETAKMVVCISMDGTVALNSNILKK